MYLAGFLLLWIALLFVTGLIVSLVIPDRKSAEYLALWGVFALIIPLLLAKKIKLFRAVFVANVLMMAVFLLSM